MQLIQSNLELTDLPDQTNVVAPHTPHFYSADKENPAEFYWAGPDGNNWIGLVTNWLGGWTSEES